jgi:N6-adenosine-specific RNA methylase IME4
MKLVLYERARQALAAANSVDEVKKLHDELAAMQEYARRARDPELIAKATELRKRSERRLDERMKAQKATVGLAKAGRHPKIGFPKNPISQPTLADAGIDKNLADRSRKAGKLTEAEFEAEVAEAVTLAVASVEGKSVVVKAVRQKRQAGKSRARAVREQTLAAKIVSLPAQRYGVIYADPPWRFEPYSRDSGMDRSADNHYPTMTVAGIAALQIPAADDCALFLWATVPMLPQALSVIEAWGFTYKSHVVWVKDKTGTGYWARNRHELLLIATRGAIPAPAPGEQPASVIDAPVGKHSVKPEVFRRLIEDLFPTVPRLEMFARGEAVDGWDRWGNEAEPPPPPPPSAVGAQTMVG